MSYDTKSFWYPSTGRRVFAILLSALLPGAGQAVLGRRGWAVFWVFASLLAVALEPAFGVWAAATVLALRLPASVQAAFLRGGGVAPDPNGKSAALVVLLFIGWAAAMTQLQHDVVENVTMVDATMYPALEAGDLTLVNKLAYGLRLPFVGRIQEKPVNVGDVVAVDDPDKPDQLLVARVVAMGPTSFEMKEGALVFAGGKDVSHAPASGECKFMEPKPGKDTFVDESCQLYVEKAAASGRTWLVSQPSAGPGGDAAGDVKKAPSTAQVRQVAQGQMVVAQDNRRGAAPWKIVPVANVRGRVTQVWFSTAGPRGIRWGRTDKKVE